MSKVTLNYEVGQERMGLREYFQRYKNNLPHILRVVQGFCSTTDMETVSTGQTILVTSYVTQRRVIGKETGNSARTISIPLDYSVFFKVKKKLGGFSQKQSLASLVEKHRLPVEAEIASLPNKRFVMGPRSESVSSFSSLRLVEVFEEHYLVGHTMDGGQLYKRPFPVPLYLSEVLVVPILGAEMMSEISWKNLLQDMAASVQLLDSSIALTNPEIALYSHDVLLEVKEAAVTSSETGPDPIYDSLEPVAYVNLRDVEDEAASKRKSALPANDYICLEHIYSDLLPLKICSDTEDAGSDSSARMHSRRPPPPPPPDVPEDSSDPPPPPISPRLLASPPPLVTRISVSSIPPLPVSEHRPPSPELLPDPPAAPVEVEGSGVTPSSILQAKKGLRKVNRLSSMEPKPADSEQNVYENAAALKEETPVSAISGFRANLRPVSTHKPPPSIPSNTQGGDLSPRGQSGKEKHGSESSEDGGGQSPRSTKDKKPGQADVTSRSTATSGDTTNAREATPALSPSGSVIASLMVALKERGDLPSADHAPSSQAPPPSGHASPGSHAPATPIVTSPKPTTNPKPAATGQRKPDDAVTSEHGEGDIYVNQAEVASALASSSNPRRNSALDMWKERESGPAKPSKPTILRSRPDTSDTPSSHISSKPAPEAAPKSSATETPRQTSPRSPSSACPKPTPDVTPKPTSPTGTKPALAATLKPTFPAPPKPQPAKPCPAGKPTWPPAPRPDVDSAPQVAVKPVLRKQPSQQDITPTQTAGNPKVLRKSISSPSGDSGTARQSPEEVVEPRKSAAAPPRDVERSTPEGGESKGGQSSEVQAPAKEKSVKTPETWKNQVEGMTIADIGERLRELRLERYVTAFREQMVDGALLSQLDVADLKSDFSMSATEARRLRMFITDGHVPK